MKAVILAGGLGTRLKPFTEVIPKPLLPVGESSVLEIQILSLARFGFDEVYVATNYMADYIEAFLGKGYTVGFLPQDDGCGTTYSVVNFESVNALNEGRYFDGFAPTCAVAEDFTLALGNAGAGLGAKAGDQRFGALQFAPGGNHAAGVAGAACARRRGRFASEPVRRYRARAHLV